VSKSEDGLDLSRRDLLRIAGGVAAANGGIQSW